ncbi:polysaccharide export protein EpsE [Pelomonas aquatica]|jgi:polysaccharide export outer membrane protein|uniref:Polysaccharide export protein EpsE n=1 Tax=Pelomonas aquatica TaxID=431058 RepID=A0A9X4LJX4_9BURK|nr:polysaccharide export protein EpsE [Pelomonas aquatica]MCY4753365.1 polysaccharide export protein EpsE [Pelomonas aquatica]MDG0861443.1 polysaccharide export protein EpsE [Pelomonas aquatica]
MSRLRLFLMAAALGLAGLAVQAQPQARAGAAALAEYRLGAGDVVRVVVYQNPDLTLETRVSETGVISYPLLGNVRIGGLGVGAAEQLIADGLRNGNYVKAPQVTLVLLQVKGNQASVLGQVNRPGRYPIETADMRMSDLLATAGGVATTGGDLVVLTGTREGKPLRLEIDLPNVFGPNGDQGRSNDVLVQNGDVLWVDRAPIVYIYGEVQRPGPMRLERGMTLMQVLAAGGGLTQRGTERGIRVHRKGSDGKVQIVQSAMDDVVKDGDVVYVKESLF